MWHCNGRRVIFSFKKTFADKDKGFRISHMILRGGVATKSESQKHQQNQQNQQKVIGATYISDVVFNIQIEKFQCFNIYSIFEYCKQEDWLLNYTAITPAQFTNIAFTPRSDNFMEEKERNEIDTCMYIYTITTCPSHKKWCTNVQYNLCCW